MQHPTWLVTNKPSITTANTNQIVEIKLKRENERIISLLARLWLGWWWDALFLHLLSPFLSNITTNRVGQVGSSTSDNECVKVNDGKEETPAHSRHPLPPIFLTPTSSRYLKVIVLGRRRRTSLSEDFQEMRMERAVNQWKERAALSRLQVDQLLNQK